MSRRPVAVALAILGLVVLRAAPVSGADSCRDLTLSDQTSTLGVRFEHESGASGLKHLPETMGAGLAWLDFDADGWLDLYLVQSGPFPPEPGSPPHGALLRNLSGRGFEDVTERAAAGHTGYGQGVLAADLDGNGAVDLLVTTFDGEQLLLNSGTGTFRNASANLTGSRPGWSSSAAAADADADGDLDLYVSRYLAYEPSAAIFCGDPESGERRYCDPSIFPGARDQYYENLGNGHFAAAAAAAGLAAATGRGLGVLFVDLDGDLRPEIYVANDLTPNLLFKNLGGGRFEDTSLLSGAAVDRDGKPEAGMGVALGDQNSDALPDLMVTNFDVETNTYYEATGALSFTDESAASGFGTPSFNSLAFGIVTADLDGDMDLDVYVANGHIFERPNRENTTYRQRDLILLGDGHGEFEALDCAWLDGTLNVARGLAMADFDNDGDPDLASQENGGPATLLQNDRQSKNWLGIVLRGGMANTAAIGARATLATEDLSQLRWATAGDSYQSTSDPRMIFALPTDDTPATLEVRWPSGRRLRLLRPPRGYHLVIAELQP